MNGVWSVRIRRCRDSIVCWKCFTASYIGRNSPDFNASMSVLQKKAIYCHVFCKIFFFSAVHPCRKICP